MIGNNKAIGGGGFHHVAMRAKDFEASVKFYTQALGFREWIRWGKAASGSEGDSRAIMLDTGDGSCLEIFAGGDQLRPEGALLHFALNSNNCDAAIEAARKIGAKVTMEPKTLEIQSTPAKQTVRIAFCTGPDGETIEFFQNLTK